MTTPKKGKPVSTSELAAVDVKVATIETLLTQFIEHQTEINSRILKAVEGNGTPGLRDRVTKLENEDQMQRKDFAVQVEAHRAQAIVREETWRRNVETLSATVAELAKSSQKCREAEELATKHIAKSVDDLVKQVADHLSPNNLQHDTIAAAFRQKPFRTILIVAIGGALFTLGAISGYFEHIINLFPFLH